MTKADLQKWLQRKHFYKNNHAVSSQS